ncbi:hypothetical protein [Methyloversatilis thermotolerans]|uniref:hypothetical protein n=1 Tax=Methyloversatilis thermotolerans TaxID=1346290 RepID=UPI0003A95E58|nr:hypothetical protein [Methyloversatilis thermotolerans]
MSAKSPLRVLLVIRHQLFLRLIEPWVRGLIERGDTLEICVTTMSADTVMDNAALHSIVGGASIIQAPLGGGRRGRLLLSIRLLQDYLRYLDPIYDECEALRNRAAAPIPWFLRAALNLLGARLHGIRWFFISLLRTLDWFLPCDPLVRDFLAKRSFDVLLVTPLVDPNSGECEYLKCAIQRGDKTALIVASWDNLTNKGLVQFVPDRIFVWNRLMAEELERLHRISREKVIVTGAPVFDPWFVMKPRASREGFCAALGLDPSKPIILYLCSSKFIAANEAESISSWVKKVRNHPDPVIRHANVLIRPHPGNLQQWGDIKTLDNVVVWPPQGEQVIDAETRSRYFDSLHHCAVVVAINTSGMLESAIVGRPVLMLSDSRSHLTQEGTLHFRHLLNGRLVHLVTSEVHHFEQLGAFLEGRDRGREQRDRFVLEFVRPFGRDVKPAFVGLRALDALCDRHE